MNIQLSGFQPDVASAVIVALGIFLKEHPKHGKDEWNISSDIGLAPAERPQLGTATVTVEIIHADEGVRAVNFGVVSGFLKETFSRLNGQGLIKRMRVESRQLKTADCFA